MLTDSILEFFVVHELRGDFFVLIHSVDKKSFERLQEDVLKIFQRIGERGPL